MFSFSINSIFPEKAFFWGYAEKISRSITGPISLIFVAIFLDLKSQGYLFTFISLLTIKFILELGLTQIIITFIAYEKNSLSFRKSFLKGKFNSYIRLKNISRYSFHWFFWASIIYILVINFVGYFLFSNSGDPISYWIYPFLLLCLFSSIEIFCIPFYAIKEGLAEIEEVYKFKFFKTIFFLLAYLALLSIGAGLWSFSIAYFFNILIDIIFIFKSRIFFYLIYRNAKVNKIRLNWKEEILPMQTKIAIGAVSGILSFSIFTPFSFSLLGPEVAGKVGLTLAIVTGISTLSVVPSLISSQRIASLVEKKEIKELNNLIYRLLSISLIIHLISLAGLILFFFLLKSSFPFILDKVLDPISFLCFFFAMMLSLISSPFSIFMRAHKEEPLMWLSVFTGVAISFGCYFGMYYNGAMGAGIAYFLISLISFPILLKIFFNFKSRYKLNS